PDGAGFEKIRNVYLGGNHKPYISRLLLLVFRKRPEIVITSMEIRNLDLYLLLFAKSFLRFKLIGWGHGWNRMKGFYPSKRFSDRLRLALMRGVDGVVLYSLQARETLSPILQKEKLFVAQNTLDGTTWSALFQEFSREGRDSVKKRISWKCRFNLTFVGRLREEKEPGKLLDVFRLVREEVQDVELHIIGQGECLPGLKDRIDKEGIQGIHIHGPMFEERSVGEMLFASDLIVIPGYVGLAVVHAFSFGVPVVTQDDSIVSPFHSPEVEYIINGRTGYLTPYGNIAAMAQVIVAHLRNPELQASMKENVLETVRTKASIEKMLQGLSDAIDFVMHDQGNG
ncbi:MAG: glycosyltransferase, partial [Thaumarchaeota archaeon]|nr:glycosyltransferase [Nitrososphaerota archaeon]